MFYQLSNNDEVLTPRYAVKAIIPYLTKFNTILCPFDKDDSMYVRELSKTHQVFNSHIETENFFDLIPSPIVDCIVSNPPFSIKDKVLERLFEIGKPFAILLPLEALGGKRRQEMFKKHGIQVIFLGGRIGFYTPTKYIIGKDDKNNDIIEYRWDKEAYLSWKGGAGFECCYICYKLGLDNDLTYATMNQVQEPYRV